MCMIDEWELKFEEQLRKSFFVRLGLSAVAMGLIWVVISVLWSAF